MKRIFSSPQLMEVQMLQNLLEEAGIATEIRNPDPGTAILPGMGLETELWLSNDDNYARAQEVKKVWKDKVVSSTVFWICSKCGEKLEEQFTSCWRCGGIRQDPVQSSGQIFSPDQTSQPSVETGKRQSFQLSKEVSVFLYGLASCFLLIIAGLALSKIVHGDYTVHLRRHSPLGSYSPLRGSPFGSREFARLFVFGGLGVFCLWRAISLFNTRR